MTSQSFTDEFQAIFLTLKLAFVTTFILLAVATPIAWWLAKTHSRFRAPIGAVISLPLVLPPTVLGFYLLLLLRPGGWIGQISESLGFGQLTFTFTGLVIGSVAYSLPFVVQPIQNAFEAIGNRPFEIAATLRMGPWLSFFKVALPMARSGFFTAAVLGFAHTLGEFGVVLMLGGNIPGETKVISVSIYDHVEAMDYAKAHALAGFMLLMSFTILLVLHWKKKTFRISL